MSDDSKTTTTNDNAMLFDDQPARIDGPKQPDVVDWYGLPIPNDDAATDNAQTSNDQPHHIDGPDHPGYSDDGLPMPIPDPIKGPASLSAHYGRCGLKVGDFVTTIVADDGVARTGSVIAVRRASGKNPDDDMIVVAQIPHGRFETQRRYLMPTIPPRGVLNDLGLLRDELEDARRLLERERRESEARLAEIERLKGVERQCGNLERRCEAYSRSIDEALETNKELREDVQERENIIANQGRAYSDARNELDHERTVCRNALAEGEAQRARAALWCAAAQDALDQMGEWRRAAGDEREANAKLIEERDAARHQSDLDLAIIREKGSTLTGFVEGLHALRPTPADAERIVEIPIINHRGEGRTMRLLAATCQLTHEPTEHYPRPSLKLTGFDVDRHALRTIEIGQTPCPPAAKPPMTLDDYACHVFRLINEEWSGMSWEVTRHVYDLPAIQGLKVRVGLKGDITGEMAVYLLPMAEHDGERDPQTGEPVVAWIAHVGKPGARLGECETYMTTCPLSAIYGAMRAFDARATPPAPPSTPTPATPSIESHPSDGVTIRMTSPDAVSSDVASMVAASMEADLSRIPDQQ